MGENLATPALLAICNVDSIVCGVATCKGRGETGAWGGKAGGKVGWMLEEMEGEAR